MGRVRYSSVASVQEEILNFKKFISSQRVNLEILKYKNEEFVKLIDKLNPLYETLYLMINESMLEKEVLYSDLKRTVSEQKNLEAELAKLSFDVDDGFERVCNFGKSMIIKKTLIILNNTKKQLLRKIDLLEEKTNFLNQEIASLEHTLIKLHMTKAKYMEKESRGEEDIGYLDIAYQELLGDYLENSTAVVGG